MSFVPQINPHNKYYLGSLLLNQIAFIIGKSEIVKAMRPNNDLGLTFIQISISWFTLVLWCQGDFF